MEIKEAVKNSFSKVLREHRSNKRLSQTELSKRSDLHRNAISLLERKERMPTLETIVKIIDGLEVDGSEYMNDFFEEFHKEINND